MALYRVVVVEIQHCTGTYGSYWTHEDEWNTKYEYYSYEYIVTLYEYEYSCCTK